MKRFFIPLLLSLLLTFVYIMPVLALESVESQEVTSHISDSEAEVYSEGASPDESAFPGTEDRSEAEGTEGPESSAASETDMAVEESSGRTDAEKTQSLFPETPEGAAADSSAETAAEGFANNVSENTESESSSESVPLPDLSTAEIITEEADEAVVGASLYTYINVTWSDFGANGGDRGDDTAALNKALYAAATSAAQARKTIEVYVPAGTYYINNVLHIYSNTWLHLDSKATITRTDISKEMLAGAHRDRNNNVCYNDCTHSGYTQVVNTKVSGGRWNGGVAADKCSGPVFSRDVLTFRHCSYITIADTTIGDDCALHTVNIDGVKNLTVSNVTFQNHYRYTGSEKDYYSDKIVTTSVDKNYWTREALHIDEINRDNYSTAFPIEVLPSLNITVTGCTFRNVLSGVGTHNYSKNNPCINVTIQGNTFHTVYYDCIHAFNFKDLTVKDNKAYNVTGFFYGKDCGGKNKQYSYIQNNTIECSTLKGYPVRDTIYCVGASRIFIENNIFRNIQASCIVIDDGASSKTDTVSSEAVINLNLMENAAGKASENKHYAAIMAGRGCQINAWKNTIYLQEHANPSFETYGVLLKYAAKGNILNKNYISGGNIGVYINEANITLLTNNEIRRTKKIGTYILRSYETEMSGNMFVSNSACGLKAESSSIKSSWRNSALWNGERDLWILYSNTFNGLGSFCANNVLSSNSGQTAVKYVEGDINFDGKLSVLDLQLLSNYISDPDRALRTEFYMADIDHNGVLNNKDISVMTGRIVN